MLSNPVVDQLWIKPVFGDNKEIWVQASPFHQLDRQTSSDNLLTKAREDVIVLGVLLLI